MIEHIKAVTYRIFDQTEPGFSRVGQHPRLGRPVLLVDLGVALKVLDDNGVASGAIRTARDTFAAGRQALGEEADHVELVKEIEKAAGVEIV